MELQRLRKRQKIQTVKYPPSQIWLQVLGNGGRDDPRAVILCTDHTNYLFNGGEGTQRLAHEHHVKLTKLEHIFITRPTWQNMGGLPGLCLTIQETGTPQILMHGPKGTRDLFEATEKFVILNQLKVKEANISKSFSDHTMAVTYIPIVNKNIEVDNDKEVTVTLDNTQYYGYQVNANGKRTTDSVEANLQPPVKKTVKKINSMMAFACKIHPKSGMLCVELCVEKGVPPGPLLGKLKNGEDITLENGEVVRSADVVSASETGKLFIVVECPDEDWLDALVDESSFKNYQMGTTLGADYVASYIVHFTPTEVLQNPKYRKWMQKFGKDCEHIIINEDNTGPSSEAIYKMQNQLHIVHPKIFPFVKNKMPESISTQENRIIKDVDGLNLHRGHTLQLAHLRPPTGFDWDSKVVIKTDEYMREMFDSDGFLDLLAELQTDINAKTKSFGDVPEYPKLLMLGTGSSIPNKCRNTSGILLQTAQDKSMILDCGEGTVGQLYKFFGKSEIDEILKSIKVIYVSHLHADHHLGLIGILKERARVTDEPVHLLAPSMMTAWLDFYDKQFETISNYYIMTSNRDLLHNQAIASSSTLKSMYSKLDVNEISTTYVKHCPFSYGVAVVLNDGRKVVYSGDTLPTDNLLKIGAKCALLIHEATHEDELETEAQIKMHSTISQAINVGQKMEAEFILLTHFSQRYSKIPLMPDKPHINREKVGIAYDFMHVSLSHLRLLPLFYPCLKLIYKEYVEAMEEKSKKREFYRALDKSATMYN